MLIAKCEYCGAVEQVPDSYAGETLECECGRDVVVPFPTPKDVSKSKAQSIVLFDSIPEESKDKKKNNTEKKDEDELGLPTDNKLEWIATLFNVLAVLLGVAAFAVFILGESIILGKVIAGIVACIAYSTLAQAFGSVELNARVNNKLIAAILKQLENNEKKLTN